MSNDTLTKQENRYAWMLIVICSLIIVGIAWYAFNYVRTSRIEASTLVARVNGEAIYESEVSRGLSDSFDSTADDMKQARIEGIISRVAIRQFLSKHGVRVREELVDKEIDNLEKNPPSMGCPCCTYPSLDAYLSAIGYTLDDLRLDISNNIGLSDYAKDAWRKSHSDKVAVMKQIGDQSKYIRERYVRAWQVFFNTFQQPGYNSDPDKITKDKGQKAQKAWDRLQRGEPFEAVAKSVSEDMTSRHKGGYLGSIDRGSYGQEFEAAIHSLKPGEYSKPVQSSWGFHIVKWQPMSDEDVIKFCESDLVDKEYKNLSAQIVTSAKVERSKSTDSGSRT